MPALPGPGALSVGGESVRLPRLRHGARAKGWIVAAGAAALALAAVSLLAFPALPRQGDSITYWRMMRWMLGEAPGPGLVLAPGYPAFLALVVRMVPFGPGPALLLAQHLLRLVPVAAMVALAWRLRSRTLAVAAALFAVAPESWVFAHFVMTETLALALCAVAAVALWRLWERPGPGRAAISGLAIGFLAAVRPVGALWLVPGFWWGGRATREGGWGRAAALIAGFAAALLPWLAFNRARTGEFALVNSVGRHLFSRIVAEDGALPAGDSGLAALNRDAGFPAGAPATYLWNYTEALRRRGLTETEADARLGWVALRGLACSPFRYAAGTVSGMAAIAVWAPEPSAGSYRAIEHALSVPGSLAEAVRDLRPFVTDPEAVEWILAELAPAFDDGWPRRVLGSWLGGWRESIGWLQWPLVLLMIAGAVRLWRGGETGGPPGWGRGFVLLAALGLLGHAAAEMPVPRYGLPYQPLTILLACEGAAWAVTGLRRGRR